MANKEVHYYWRSVIRFLLLMTILDETFVIVTEEMIYREKRPDGYERSSTGSLKGIRAKWLRHWITAYITNLTFICQIILISNLFPFILRYSGLLILSLYMTVSYESICSWIKKIYFIFFSLRRGTRIAGCHAKILSRLSSLLEKCYWEAQNGTKNLTTKMLKKARKICYELLDTEKKHYHFRSL